MPNGETRAPTPFIAAPTTFKIAGLQPDWRPFCLPVLLRPLLQGWHKRDSANSEKCDR